MPMLPEPHHGVRQFEESWNPAHYEKGFSFVWKYGQDLIAILAPAAGERILDLGCGTGQLSAAIAKCGAKVTGIDSASEMIERARGNYPHLQFEVADARQFRTPESYDAVFSNAALHWIKDADAVAVTIALSLRPSGRLVADWVVRATSSLSFARARKLGSTSPEENPASNSTPGIFRASVNMPECSKRTAWKSGQRCCLTAPRRLRVRVLSETG